MDIGCGDGALGAAMVDRLIKLGKVRDVAEICLVDSSQGMLDLAKETVGKVFPAKVIRTVHSKIQAFTDQIDRRYDVALASLAYHHMPMETKLVHMEKLRRWVDHYLLFEIDANNDTPEHLSPQLSLAVYQCYGRITDFVFAHDAPVEVAVSCVDRFLMSEAVSFLTQRRGERTDYHMLRSQWHDLFARGLGPDFSCWADANCYSDEFFELMYLHYGRR
jgi:SAM-dependent methyltransferase